MPEVAKPLLLQISARNNIADVVFFVTNTYIGIGFIMREALSLAFPQSCAKLTQ